MTASTYDRLGDEPIPLGPDPFGDRRKSRRLTVTLREQDVDALARIARERGVSPTDAIRRALASEVWVSQRVADDNSILLENGDGTIRQVSFGDGPTPAPLILEGHGVSDVDPKLVLSDGDEISTSNLARLLDTHAQPAPTDKLIVVRGIITPSALRSLASNPHEMYALTPREFEQLVAELLHRSGYSVLLGPGSKDRGVDVRAVRPAPIDPEILVQCKRYTPPNKVTAATVREMAGVITLQKAASGAVVTTSYFTEPAKLEQQEMPNRLKLVDIDSLMAWIKLSSRPSSRTRSKLGREPEGSSA